MRRLSSDDLSQAIGGSCDTTSFTTEGTTKTKVNTVIGDASRRAQGEALMKKTATTRKSVLQLSHETIRTLRGGDLSRVISGCDTTSFTTEGTTTMTTSQHTEGATARNCGPVK